MDSMRVGVQLYTVREEMDRGLRAAFMGIAEAGLGGVELWFKGSYPPAPELVDIAEKSGLAIFSAHVPFIELRDRFDDVAEYHRAIGNVNLTIPVIPEHLRKTEDDWRRRVEEIETIAKKAQLAGFHLHYHNHTMEFTDSVGEKDVHDYLFERVSAEMLKAELDTCFIKRVGKDPSEYIHRYADRATLLHIKDANPKEEPVDTILGDGTVDWRAVFAAVEKTDIEWLVMEQGHHEIGAFDSIRRSLEYLRACGFVN